VGKAAEAFEEADPSHVISDVKRMIGRKLSDPTIKKWKKYWPFILNEHEGEEDTFDVNVSTEGEPQVMASPWKVAAAIIQFLGEGAAKRLGCPVGGVVIALPYELMELNELQDHLRQAIQAETGWKAEFIPESEAATWAYLFLSERPPANQKLLIIDFGAGKLEITFADIHSECKISYTHWSYPALGEMDLDLCIAQAIQKEPSLFGAQRPISMFTLLKKCREVKERLSTPGLGSAEISVEWDDGQSGKPFLVKEEYLWKCCQRHQKLLWHLVSVQANDADGAIRGRGVGNGHRLHGRRCSRRRRWACGNRKQCPIRHQRRPGYIGL
jgi:L1 cell adhesion molecule like protein